MAGDSDTFKMAIWEERKMTENKPKVLLTASYGPNDLGYGEDMFDISASRLNRGHGPFLSTSHCHYLGLYLIAENISLPTTIIENPHWDEFDRELDEGYDYVGIQLKSLHTPKIARMMKRVREKLPRAKIIVGGYGASALRHIPPGDKDGDGLYVRENADYLCRGEGVSFMRRILGDEPIDREITQYQIPTPGFSPAGTKLNARGPTVLVALGCPNACDFCNTSAALDHKKVYVADPQQVIKFIKHYQTRMGTKNIFVTLYDEDFFINKDYVRELGELLRADRDLWGVKYFAFASVRSLSQFEPEEIRDNGCGAVWIGVESFLLDEQGVQNRYDKRKGNDIKKLFDDLHGNGIQTTASIVLGFDFHTPENLKEDLDRFVELKPEAYQISPLLPCPGTALFEKMQEDERLYDTYKWEDVHLWSGEQFEMKNLERGQIKEYYDYAHERLRDENGPPMLQSLENAIDSHEMLSQSDQEFHAFRAGVARKMANGSYLYIRAIKKHHHSPKVRQRAEELENIYLSKFGKPKLKKQIISLFLSNRINKISKAERPPVVSDPPIRWSYYNTFDDRVWVKKGRGSDAPVPYVDTKWSPFSIKKMLKSL
jgi:haloalkane dehalogenase